MSKKEVQAMRLLIHFVIVFHLEGVIFKGAQLLNRQLHGLYIFFTQGQ